MKFLYLTGAALLATACSNSADNAEVADESTATDTAITADDGAATADAAAQPTDAAGYIAAAGAGDKWEIESSRAAMAKSTNDDVKKFAQMMIDQHSQSTQKIKAAANEAKLSVGPAVMTAEQQRMLDEISKTEAGGVDAVYWRHQRTAHEQALALHRAYAERGDNPALKKVAAEIAPVIERHIAELDRIASARAGATTG